MKRPRVEVPVLAIETAHLRAMIGRPLSKAPLSLGMDTGLDCMCLWRELYLPLPWRVVVRIAADLAPRMVHEEFVCHLS